MQHVILKEDGYFNMIGFDTIPNRAVIKIFPRSFVIQREKDDSPVPFYPIGRKNRQEECKALQLLFDEMKTDKLEFAYAEGDYYPLFCPTKKVMKKLQTV